MNEPEPAQLELASRLAACGLEDPVVAQRLILGLAGQGVSDDDIAPLVPLLLHALGESPDPDRALHSFARWFEAVGSRTTYLRTLIAHPVSVDIFCLVAGCSQYFADLLSRNPEYFEILANPGVRSGAKSAGRLFQDVSSLVDICRLPELKRDALRRWKAREMLRIGVRDLLGLADMPTTALEFSNLADACVQKALDIALAAAPLRTPSLLPFTVIGMGKLGGRELNYSSDIDLMFLHGDDLPDPFILADGRKQESLSYLSRLAESVVSILAAETANGHVFRVDMRLRPEGRFGALTRSLGGFRAYYENWAENWEWQALLKARFLAGDRTLAEAFFAMAEPFIYRRSVSYEFVEEIRHNKRKIEQVCDLEGQTLTNVKTGFGGIRDVEFTVQLLQLQRGGAHPRLRTGNTLTALTRLAQAGDITPDEAAELADNYQFLRTLEHRLQLLHGFQTQTLPPPEAPEERARLARRMGYENSAAFEQDLDARRGRVRALCNRLFFGQTDETVEPSSQMQTGGWDTLLPLLDNIEAPSAREALGFLLKDHGFKDIPAALRALQLPMRGNDFGEMPPDTPVEFQRIAPRLMAAIEQSPNPDAGLAGLEELATAVPNRAQLYAALDDSPQVLDRLVRLAAASPPLLQRLCKHQEWMELLLGSDHEEEEVDGANLPDGGEELAQRLAAAPTADAKVNTLARYHMRETLRIGARDLWEEDSVTRTMDRLSRLAAVMLEAMLSLSRQEQTAAAADPDTTRRILERVAIIGLGKLGGGELGYAGDWDILFVYDEGPDRRDREASARRFAVVSELAERVVSLAKLLPARGASVEIDLRLRPWGRKGALIHSPRAFIDYYRTAGETWERQAALKARFVAGCPAVGRRFERIFHAVSFGHGLNAEEDAAVQNMKRRLETERLKAESRHSDLKLGYGGLTDVEWLAQRLCLLAGKRRPVVRRASTLSALSALASVRMLSNAEVDLLAENYKHLTRLRNMLFLSGSSECNELPADAARLQRTARMMGYTDSANIPAGDALREETARGMRDTREIFTRRFYEADSTDPAPAERMP